MKQIEELIEVLNGLGPLTEANVEERREMIELGDPAAAARWRYEDLATEGRFTQALIGTSDPSVSRQILGDGLDNRFQMDDGTILPERRTCGSFSPPMRGDR